jgi:hypothetical protein
VNASSVVVTAQSRGKVKLHTVVVYRMVVQMAVGAAVPTEAVVGHMVRTVVAVRMVLLTVDSRGGWCCPSGEGWSCFGSLFMSGTLIK